MGAPSSLHFLLDQTFFGFNASYRMQLHETIFNIIWFGEGRWDWETIYTMPVFLRNFWVKKINKIIEDQNKAAKQQTQKSNR